MPRASLGARAKSVIGSVRLTPAEAEELTKRFGSVTKALRALVTANLKGSADG